MDKNAKEKVPLNHRLQSLLEDSQEEQDELSEKNFHKCYFCDRIGQLYYLPRDSIITSKHERWRCQIHGQDYFDDPEWEFIEWWDL